MSPKLNTVSCNSHFTPYLFFYIITPYAAESKNFEGIDVLVNMSVPVRFFDQLSVCMYICIHNLISLHVRYVSPTTPCLI
jgi:hypothetical protein